MELRGFDSYEVTLGDEMRGERASLGKTMRDAERELRIKAAMLAGIEDCDLSAFKNHSVIPGYVRSYARYLGMDPEECYRRFCEASGFTSPAAKMLGETGSRGLVGLAVPIGATSSSTAIDQSRFTAPPGRNRFQARVSLGALTSTLSLVALIGGLGYGGYALLQDIQRVAIAPLPQAPTVVATAPSIAPPTGSADGISRPKASDYASGGALAAYSGPSRLPTTRLRRRDGPISAIDPSKAGMFAPLRPPTASAPVAPATRTTADEARTIVPIVAATPRKPGMPPIPKRRKHLGVVVHASAKAWIKISDRNNITIWQGTLKAGQRYQVPANALAPVVRSGNAGKTFVIVDGVAYGPLGDVGKIARDVPLAVDRIHIALPKAKAAILTAGDGAAPPISAEARRVRP